jgi:hypothetical protein
LIRPTLALANALNLATRQDDEWFDEPDDRAVANLLVKAAAGQDVQDDLV